MKEGLITFLHKYFIQVLYINLILHKGILDANECVKGKGASATNPHHQNTNGIRLQHCIGTNHLNKEYYTHILRRKYKKKMHKNGIPLK